MRPATVRILFVLVLSTGPPDSVQAASSRVAGWFATLPRGSNSKHRPSRQGLARMPGLVVFGLSFVGDFTGLRQA
jgi:hypothetical protein